MAREQTNPTTLPQIDFTIPDVQVLQGGPAPHPVVVKYSRPKKEMHDPSQATENLYDEEISEIEKPTGNPERIWINTEQNN